MVEVGDRTDILAKYRSPNIGKLTLVGTELSRS